MITKTFITNKLLQDADGNIRIIDWKYEFTDGTTDSYAEGKTVVPEGMAVSASDDIEATVIQIQGGQEWLNEVLKHVGNYIEIQTLEKSLTEVTG